MEPVIMGLIFTLLGLFFIAAAVWEAKFIYQEPMNLEGQLMHRAIMKNFGRKGKRNFVIIAGVVIIMFGMFFIFISGITGIRIKSNPPDISFSGLVRNPMNPDEMMEGSYFMTTDIREALPLEEDKNIHEGRAINAKLKKVPNKIWNMKNLKSLDLSKNKLSEINIDSLKQLNILSILILSGNPMKAEYVEDLRKQFPDMQIIF